VTNFRPPRALGAAADMVRIAVVQRSNPVSAEDKSRPSTPYSFETAAPQPRSSCDLSSLTSSLAHSRASGIFPASLSTVGCQSRRVLNRHITRPSRFPPLTRQGASTRQAMGSLQWALSWLVVGAVGLAPMRSSIGCRGDRASLPAQAKARPTGRGTSRASPRPSAAWHALQA
jgi:hypothetical protein